MTEAPSPTSIRLLPENLANQIAAGEVVERPASVLKELIENALDAGAGRVQIEVAGGGKRLLRVVDDGVGMSGDDVFLALESHATSKLRTPEDLLAVATYGFRGEALASVAAVSRLRLRSRCQADATGSEVVAQAGQVRQVNRVGCPVGTLVEVRDLFFNTPARKKFLKSRATESAHLAEVLVRMALARPEVAFRYQSEGRMLHDLPASQNLLVRAAGLLGREAAGEMVELDQDAGGCHLGGLAGLPSLSRSGPDQIYTFVNGRFVRDKVLLHAVGQAYQGLLPGGRRPVAVLHITMDPAQVDVNVHPAKIEVRFRQQAQVHDGLVEALRRGLAASRLAAAAGAPRPQPHPAPARPGPSWAAAAPTPPRVAQPRPPLSLAPEPRLPDPLPEAPAGDFPPPRAQALFGPAGDLTVIGQLHGLYIICSSPQGLVIIDQHAAHERLAYEQLKAGLERGSVPRQGLLAPATLELSPQEHTWAERQAGQWGRLGLEMTPFGGRTWLVTTVPPLLLGQDPAPVVRDLLSDLAGTGVPAGTPEFMEVALRSLACRAAIKSGQRLGLQESQDLAARVAALPPPVTCPHGRPVMLTLGRAELARSFKRSFDPGS